LNEELLAPAMGSLRMERDFFFISSLEQLSEIEMVVKLELIRIVLLDSSGNIAIARGGIVQETPMPILIHARCKEAIDKEEFWFTVQRKMTHHIKLGIKSHLGCLEL
jgi:hypothetical protein